MVGKLMKYEFLRTWKILALIHAISVTLVFLASLVYQLNKPFVYLLINLLTFVVVALPQVSQIYLAIEAYLSMYGRRGYLTHSIPVKGQRLLMVKLIYMVIITLLSAVLCYTIMLIGSYFIPEMNVLSLSAIWKLLATGDPMLVVLIAAMAFLVLSFANVQWLFCVTFGAEEWINKLGGAGPLVVNFLLGFALQIPLLISLFIPPSYNINLGELAWDKAAASFGGVSNDLLPIAILPIFLLATVVMFWRMRISVNKKLALR